jgi:hypothetical protein
VPGTQKELEIKEVMFSNFDEQYPSAITVGKNEESSRAWTKNS